jgi:chemotaxis response regulator CheB
LDLTFDTTTKVADVYINYASVQVDKRKVVSVCTEKVAETTLNALSAGAFDYVSKNMDPASLDITHIQPDLIEKIRAAAQSRAISFQCRKPPHRVESEIPRTTSAAPEIVAIGI